MVVSKGVGIEACTSFLVILGYLKLKFPGNSNVNGCRTYAELFEYAIKPYEMKIQALSDN